MIDLLLLQNLLPARLGERFLPEWKVESHHRICKMENVHAEAFGLPFEQFEHYISIPFHTITAQ